ncbi:MAG: hypothetical protein ACI8ZB_005567 [Desulforhopalus sp.]|jgi:hypothetical protein
MKSIQMIVVISALALFVTSVSAQSSTTSPQTMKMKNHGNMSMESSMMHNNMSSMGQLMQKMADTLNKQNMSAEQRRECATHMERLSKVMMECAHDQKLENVETHKKEIDNLTKEWNYFESEEFESH